MLLACMLCCAAAGYTSSTVTINVWFNFSSFLGDTTLLDGVQSVIADEVIWFLDLTNSSRCDFVSVPVA